MYLAKLLTYLLFAICLLTTSSTYAQELEGPLKVCEHECYEYYYFGENGGPFFWTAEGGVMEDNRGPQVTICWEEVQTASIQVLNASVSQTTPELDLAVTISATPETDIIFPIYPLCEIKADSIIDNPNGEFPPLENCKTVCPGSIVTYYSTNGDSYERQWIIEGHQNIDSDSLRDGTVHWNEEGYGSILLIEQTDAGCIDSSYYCIEIMEQPEINLGVLNDNIDLQNLCKGQAVYLQGSADQALSYEWQTSDGQSYLGAEATVSFAQSGNYTISLVTTTECVCMDTTTLEVQVMDDVVPAIDCVGTTCSGKEQTYYATDICGTYNWSISSEGSVTDGGSGSDNFIKVVWNDGPTGTVSLSTAACDDSNICRGTNQVVIPVMGASLEIEGPDVACKNGTSTDFSVPYFSGASYNWTVADNGYISDGWGTNKITVTWNPAIGSSNTSTIEVFVDNCFLECTSAATKTVDLKEKFHISTRGKSCEGSTDYLVTVVGWNEVPTDWTLITPDGTETAVATGVGSYNVTYDQGPGIYEFIATESSGDYCNSQDRVSVEVIATPEPPGEIVGAAFVCVGESYVYKLADTSDNLEYSWTITDGSTTQRLSGSEILVSWTSGGPYEVSVSLRDKDTGCESESSTLAIGDSSGGALQGVGISCIDQKGYYQITGVLPQNLEWEVLPSTAGTIGLLEDGEIAVHWHESGKHTVEVVYCGARYDLEVEVLSPPSVTVMAPDAVCVGELAEVNFVGTAGSSYKVFDEEEKFVSLTTTDPALLPAGYYGVEITDANGCTARESFYLDSYEKPAINISSIGWHQLCLPGGTALLESVTMNKGLSFQWYKDGNPVGTDSPKHLADEEGNYKLVVTNANGCTAEDSKYLECRQGSCDCRSDGGTKFTATKTDFCNVFDFKNESFDFIAGTLQYNFGDPDSGTDNFSSDENPSHTFTKAGHYVVTLSARVNSTNIPGEECLARYQSYVTVEAVADFDQVSACMGEEVKFEELSNFLEDYSIDSYEWNFGDPSSGANNSATTVDPVHVFDSPGLYPVTLTITTNTGCKSEITKEIEVYGTPEIDFHLPFSKCIEEGLEFVVSSPAMFEIEWSFGDPASGAANTSSNQAPLHSFMTAGTYTINLKGVSIYGCEDMISKTITVSENTLVGDITMDKTMPMCLGETATLTAPAGGIAYIWSTGETTDEILVTESGLYSVTITGSNVCDYVPDAVIVNTMKPLDPSIRASVTNESSSYYGDLAICQGNSFTLNGSYHFGAEYLWSTGSTDRRIPYSDLWSLPAGEHLIELEVKDRDSGCVISAEAFELTIHPLPAAVSISSNQSDNCEGPEFVFSVDNADPDLLYFWNNGMEGTSITVTKPDYYFATAINKYGCTRNSNGLRINPLPNTETFLTGCQEVCFPKTLCLNAESSVASWQWLLDGQPISPPAGTGATLEATEVGDYQVILTSIYGCESTTGILSLTPETKQQALSGSVYVDEDGDGAFSLGERVLDGVKVRVVSGNTILQEVTTDLTGAYLFDPLEISEATVVVDTTDLDFVADPSEIEYSFQLLDCTEDVTQDFPLTKNCSKISEEVVLFTCSDGQTSFEGKMYDASERDTLYRINFEGCDSLVYLEVQAYPTAFAQTITTNTCPGEISGSLELTNPSSTDLEYSVDGEPFTSDMIFSGLAEGLHSLTIRDTYSCETEIAFSIDETIVPQISAVTEVDCDNIGKVIIDNLGNTNLMYALDGSGAFSTATEITNLVPGAHLLTVQDENGCTAEENIVIDSYVVPTVDFSLEESCFDGLSGSLAIEPSSSQNLTFGIDNAAGLSSVLSFSDLAAGNHILHVEDMAGCTYEYPFVIATVATPDYSLATNNSCADESNGALEITTTETDLSFSLDAVSYTPDLDFPALSTGGQKLYIKTAEGCILEETFMIDAFAVSPVDVGTDKSCYGLSTGTLIASSQNPLMEYALDGAAFDTATEFENLAPGNYEVTAKDENGCEQKVSAIVGELLEMQIDFPDANVDCKAQLVDLTPLVLQGEDVVYTWDDGSSDPNLVATQTGSYTVAVSDNCVTDTYTWDVIIEDKISTDLYMPNIFDPNDAGENGAFGVQLSSDLTLTNFELTIMDKWGNDIYSSRDPSEAWDGRSNNREVDPGVFLWMYKAEYEVCDEITEVQEVGSITLLK